MLLAFSPRDSSSLLTFVPCRLSWLKLPIIVPVNVLPPSRGTKLIATPLLGESPGPSPSSTLIACVLAGFGTNTRPDPPTSGLLVSNPSSTVRDSVVRPP